MKKIQSTPIWVNGVVKSGTWLGAYIINDNLTDQAQFYWWIAENGYEPDSIGSTLTQGNLTISGADYISWNSSTDVNEDAFVWIAAQLSLTLIP